MNKILPFFLMLLTFKTVVFYSIMPYEEYMKLHHDIPYIFTVSSKDRHLFYFGANHSSNPENYQYLMLEKFWDEFLVKTGGQNSVVVVEGCLRNVKGSKEEAILAAGGEGGFITFLAYQQNIKRVCFEPDDTFLLFNLSAEFSLDHIYYSRFAQICLQFHRNKEINSDLIFEEYFDSKNFYEYVGFLSLERLIEIHKEVFKKDFDLEDRQFFYDVTNPVKPYSVIGQIIRRSSMLRDQAIVKGIHQLVSEGKNVFVVYGATHAVMQKQVILEICK